ncbi:putative glutamine transport system permease protein [Paenibacillus sp. UNC496MF]|uniref:amino acid ABC transporter permease n=1 Tax=Paenibacillus sp. UNC496MF TaxID=1502753 RepID=UPI0008EC7322|nr:amino acid ABC transporter permease [Paenibacillus sp. UNC496MF]SFI39056.1 putative glutamine transport system permease protein [Paenibacillus sp. UNC496MF]
MDIAGAFAYHNLIFILKGFSMTLWVAFVAIVASFALGGIAGTLRYMRIPAVSPAIGAVVEIIRNLPLLLILFFTYFAMPDVGIKLSVTSAAIVGLTVFEAAMISEVVRGGLNAVPKGQIEAARSSGLTRSQTIRYIVLPQGLRAMVPPLVSQFISLLKDTSLAIVISLPELMHNAKIIIAQQYDYTVPVLAVVAVLYFAVNYALSIAARRLENKRV